MDENVQIWCGYKCRYILCDLKCIFNVHKKCLYVIKNLYLISLIKLTFIWCGLRLDKMFIGWGENAYWMWIKMCFDVNLSIQMDKNVYLMWIYLYKWIKMCIWCEFIYTNG